MNVDDCLRSELGRLLALVELAVPRMADRRPWYLRWAAAWRGVLL